jgi:O-antigen ligase
LTGRTAFWEELITFGTNPLIGTGYESFWLGDRIAYFWDKYWWRPNQAHNGYIELYLNIGFLGLTLLATLIIAAVRNIKKNISSMNSYNYQILRLTFIVIVLAVNVTEAYFKGPVWFVFLVLAMEPPKTLTSGTD